MHSTRKYRGKKLYTSLETALGGKINLSVSVPIYSLYKGQLWHQKFQLF